MKNFRADIHCHSTYSDGTFTPEELILEAKKIGLSGLSITDHDTINAYDEAFALAQKHDLELIPGIEFSTVYNGKSIHILAYSFDVHDPRVREFCERHQRRRTNRNRAILEKLRSAGMPIEEKELQSTSTVGRPHIAQAMIAHGYVSSINAAFNQYIGDNKSCYATGDSFSTEETVELIKEINGIAVIAHPHLVYSPGTVQQLLALPFDGIECYYAKLNPSQEKRWLKIAKERDLLITGGSDFHGSVKPDIPLGCSWINEETFSRLKERYVENTT